MNAISRQKIEQSPKGTDEVLPDGSMVISRETLARFGKGILPRQPTDEATGRKELRLLLSIDREGAVFNGPTELPKSVRIAGPQDEANCLELWLQDLKENAEHIAPIDEAKVLENIRAGTRMRGGLCAVIDGPEGKPVAITVLHPLEWHWSRGRYWQELVTYVHPDHRRSRYVYDLINFGKWASDKQSEGMGYRFYLICGVLGAWRVRAKAALYRRMAQMVGVACVYPSPPMKGN